MEPLPKMKNQYFSAQIETRQGRNLQIVLLISHNPPTQFNTLPNQTKQKFKHANIQGKLEVFQEYICYQSQINYTNLNADIVWDQKYIDLLRECFLGGKDRYVNLIDNKLTMVIEISKGIKVVVLTARLKQKDISSMEGLISAFVNVQDYFEEISDSYEQKMKQTEQSIKKIDAKALRLCQQSRVQSKRLKEEGLEMLNFLKTQVKLQKDEIESGNTKINVEEGDQDPQIIKMEELFEQCQAINPGEEINEEDEQEEAQGQIQKGKKCKQIIKLEEQGTKDKTNSKETTTEFSDQIIKYLIG